MIESFNDIIEEISNKRISDEKLNEQISLANKILEKIPKNKKKELIKTSINSLINEIKNKNYKKSFGISRFIFLSNFTNQIEMIRKLGAFRSSKYNYQSKLIREIILDIYNKKNFNNEDELYLSNIASLVAPTIFSQSNLIRALSLNENIHLSTFENIDHMISSVKNAFEKQKFYVKTDFEYGNDEVDIIAFLNGHLFIFECKNPYHPVNTYELRNTYNHLLKGFKQINKIKGILNEKNSLKQFLKNLKIEQNSIIDIHYGIINANRALYGLKKDDIKVLHANELINFLENGKFISMNKIYQSWENENFNVNDLIKFINGDIITSDFEKIKVDLFNEYKLRERSMIFITNTFDITQLKQHNDKKYKQKEMINLQ